MRSMARSRKGVRRFVTGGEAARLIVLKETETKQASTAKTPTKDKPASDPKKPAPNREATCAKCHLVTRTHTGRCLHCSASLTP
jgi:hypothetical protein